MLSPRTVCIALKFKASIAEYFTRYNVVFQFQLLEGGEVRRNIVEKYQQLKLKKRNKICNIKINQTVLCALAKIREQK